MNEKKGGKKNKDLLLLEVHEVRCCDVRGRCGALGSNFSVSLHTRWGAVLIGCSVCRLCPRLLHHDLKTCSRDAKRVLKQTEKHFKTIPHKFPFVLLNFTFPIFPLKEANHHILFVFHPSAEPERMKKQQKAKWNGNPTSVTSQQRGPRKHTRSQTKLVQVKWIYLLSLLPEEPQPDGFLMGNSAGESVGLQISKIKTSQQAFASWVLS